MRFLRSLFSNGRGPVAPAVIVPEPRPRIDLLVDEGSFALIIQQLDAILRNRSGARARLEVVIQITHDPPKPRAHAVEVGAIRITGIPALRRWTDYAVFWASAWRSSHDGGQPANRAQGIPIPTTADLQEAGRKAGARAVRTIKRFNIQQQ